MECKRNGIPVEALIKIMWRIKKGNTDMNAMTIISVVITILFLGILYWRMVKREIPEPVAW